MARRAAASAEPEEPLPEADRLTGFPHPRETPVLFGQEAAEAVLLEAWVSGRVHHAWMLAGPEGVGKATLAYRFARFALAGGPGAGNGSLAVDPALPVSRQVAVLSHPGLLVIRRPWNFQTKKLGTVIPVDEVRRLKDFLSLSAEAGRYRIVIVDRCEEMNVNAANALLKSLEEPPRRTVFLLVTAEPGKLLATIQSRCRRLDLPPLGPADLERAIAGPLAAAMGKSERSVDGALLAALSEGSVRRALVLASGGGLALYERMRGVLSALPRLDHEAIHKLADDLGAAAAEQEFLTYSRLLEDCLARLLRQVAKGQGAAAPEQELASRLIRQGTLATWAELWETLIREKAQILALNLDRRSFVLETWRRMAAAARAGS